MTDEEITKAMESAKDEFREATTELFEETLLERVMSDDEPREKCIEKFRKLCTYELIEFDAFVGNDEFDDRFVRRWKEGRLGLE